MHEVTGTKLSGPQNFTPNDFVYTHVGNLTSELKVHFRCFFFLFPATILLHQYMVGYIITRVITIFDLALGLSP